MHTYISHGRPYFCSIFAFGTLQTEPYLILRKSSDGKPFVGNDRYEGYCADLAKKIAEIIKIEYVIIPVKDGKYGGMDENKTWNGIVGEIIRNVSQQCGLHGKLLRSCSCR